MSVEEHWRAGLEAVKEKRWEDAIEQLEAARELEEDNPRLRCYLGACYGQLGQFLEAEHHLSVACELAPDMAVAHYNLGRTFEARGRIEMAIRSYENALRADRAYAPARAALKALNATLSPDLREEDEQADPAEPEGAEHHQGADC